MLEISIKNSTNDDNASAVKTILAAYNKKHTEHLTDCNNDPLEIIAKENGKIIAGLLGRSIWGTLQIQFLAVDEAYKGQGLGKKLMLEAERIARERKCHYIAVDTFSFQAPEFYKALGYKIFAEEVDFPLTFSRYYLRKTL
ncbi:GNAT family N-acetyltransferase [Ignatzschineria rhizosphaerae]|uniref:GNAT family N-acetyltransferase n=1 Tax=Ignatzschineria rhizosphaerae TaxID=2923279 RepID=A0ABY3X397_9GAMM|nr:GNAT family N-acetyltransferase [Ignatzschineria rhizosphaerae]UNM96370.1 GNAT family N-acetyltransferase [Ignatzschineria rhizosphaerae]